MSGPRPRSSWLLSPPPCLCCWPAANCRCFDALRCADRYSSTCLRVVEVPHLLPEATRTESPSSASELDCQPRLSAARLAPDCPDPPGERIPGVSYFGCSPASRAKLLATLSPREDVWPGRSARAPGLPLHRECGGWESPAPRAVILSLSAYSTRLSQALVGSVDPVCPGLTAPGALPLAQRLRLPPGPTTVVAPALCQ